MGASETIFVEEEAAACCCGEPFFFFLAKGRTSALITLPRKLNKRVGAFREAMHSIHVFINGAEEERETFSDAEGPRTKTGGGGSEKPMLY